MEELRNIVKKKNKYSLEDSYHKACSDKDFYNYVKTLPIEEELLIKYTSSLEDCVKERKLCRNCPGIKECPLSVKGFVLTPEKNGKRVIFSYVPCSHKKEDLYKENIKYFDISRDVRDASLQNVYKDDKGRLPLIKYINDFIKNFDNEEVESKGLYLTGSFGSGKTYMVSAILNEMAKRVCAAKMLSDGKTYTEIAKDTGLSTATISRVNRSLKYGSDGYVRALERIDYED